MESNFNGNTLISASVVPVPISSDWKSNQLIADGNGYIHVCHFSDTLIIANNLKGISDNRLNLHGYFQISKNIFQFARSIPRYVKEYFYPYLHMSAFVNHLSVRFKLFNKFLI